MTSTAPLMCLITLNRAPMPVTLVFVLLFFDLRKKIYQTNLFIDRFLRSDVHVTSTVSMDLQRGFILSHPQ